MVSPKENFEEYLSTTLNLKSLDETIGKKILQATPQLILNFEQVKPYRQCSQSTVELYAQIFEKLNREFYWRSCIDQESRFLKHKLIDGFFEKISKIQ